jgi:hypothetical protein
MKAGITVRLLFLLEFPMVAERRFWHNCAMRSESNHDDDESVQADVGTRSRDTQSTQSEVERGGPAGPEPTRYGDWEKNGRCIDF